MVPDRPEPDRLMCVSVAVQVVLDAQDAGMVLCKVHGGG